MNVVNFSQYKTITSAAAYTAGATMDARWVNIINTGDGTTTKVILVKKITPADDGSVSIPVPANGTLMVTGISNFNQVQVKCADNSAGYNINCDVLN